MALLSSPQALQDGEPWGEQQGKQHPEEQATMGRRTCSITAEQSPQVDTVQLEQGGQGGFQLRSGNIVSTKPCSCRYSAV